MGADGKIEVELSLLTEKAKRQGAGAADDLRKEFDKLKTTPPNINMGGSKGGGMSNTEWNSWNQARMQAAGRGGGIVTPPTGLGSQSRQGGFNMPHEMVLAQGAKQLMGMGELFPKGQQGNSLAAMFENMITKPLSGPLQMLAKVAAGLATFRVGMGLVTFALRPVTHWAHQVAMSFQEVTRNAAGMWTKVLQSRGLPPMMTAQGQTLGKIFGVSGDEVYRLGLNFSDMARRASEASRVMLRNTPVLAGIEQTNRLAGQVRAASKSERAAFWADWAQAWADFKLRIAKAELTNAQAMSISYGKPVGSPAENLTRANLDRISASPMERAGLVLGNMGGMSPMVRTANNTAEMKTGIKEIAKNTVHLTNMGRMFKDQTYYQGNPSRP